jgi:tRNA 2-thiouridine synthesizing protein E
MSINLHGHIVDTDDQGYLVDPEEWNEEVARILAEQQGLELSDEHEKVMQFMRDYFIKHQIAADARFVIKYIADELGYGDEARKRLYTLFPYGYMQQACKVAGMKRPRAWSTG